MCDREMGKMDCAMERRKEVKLRGLDTVEKGRTGDSMVVRNRQI